MLDGIHEGSVGSGDEFGVMETTDRERERRAVSPLLRRVLDVSLQETQFTRELESMETEIVKHHVFASCEKVSSRFYLNSGGGHGDGETPYCRV